MTVMSDFSESIIISSLNNPDSYKSELTDNLEDILFKYNQIINDYTQVYMENIKITDKNYYYYLFLNGIKTINNVFSIILLYTRNLNISNFYTQKSFYLYIEFISQIDNINHSFLELNGKDASLFVFKKTIYEIDNNYRKDYICSNENIFNIISIFTNLTYNFYSLIDSNTSIEIFKKELIINNEIINNILISIIDVLVIKPNNNLQNNNVLIIKLISKFIQSLLIQIKNENKNHNINLSYCEPYISILISKIKKTKINEQLINQITSCKIDNIINKNPKKVIDILFKI